MTQVAEFSDRLKQLLDGDSNINATELAKRVNTTKQSISRYVNGERSPKQIVLLEIANVFGVSPAWLAGFDVPKHDVDGRYGKLPNPPEANADKTAIVSIKITDDDEFTSQEKELIKKYRTLSLEEQSQVLAILYGKK